MYPGEHFWWGGWWMLMFPMLMPIIFIIVIIAGLYFLFGRGRFRPPWWDNYRSESALDILKKRYAKGEISKEEFERMKKDLLS